MRGSYHNRDDAMGGDKMKRFRSEEKLKQVIEMNTRSTDAVSFKIKKQKLV